MLILLYFHSNIHFMHDQFLGRHKTGFFTGFWTGMYFAKEQVLFDGTKFENRPTGRQAKI